MEILGEIIVAIFQIIAEFLLQVLWQIIGELIGHGIREVFRNPEPLSPWLAAIGYAALGAIGGGVSLLVVPELYIRSHWLRGLNLVLTPIVAGFAMGALGAWRRRQRFIEALRLLAEGESVTAVANKVGYSTSSAFGFAFHRELGETPARYFQGQ